MRQQWMRCFLLWIAVLSLIIGASGCSSIGGATLFPSGHQLLESTEEVRAKAPHPAPLPKELQKSVLPAYYVEPGDTLLIEPVKFDSPLRFPADQTVLVDGTIDLGSFGRLRVAGQTVEQIEAQVNAVVKADDPEASEVNVRLLDPQGAVFYVLGEVSAPGAYPLIGRETVLDGLLTAGGLTDMSSPCNIILSRPTLPGSCRMVLPICYRRIVQLGDTSTNYQLKPGDRIYVATRSPWGQMFGLFCEDCCPLCCDHDCPCPSPEAVETYPGILPARPVAPEGPTIEMPVSR